MKRKRVVLSGVLFLVLGTVGIETPLFAKATEKRVDLHDKHDHFASALSQDETNGATFFQGFEYAGLLELETVRTGGETDTTMATVELGAGLQITDWVHADVVFLYEEVDTDPMELDQFYITLGNMDEYPFYLQVGKLYAPFGNLDSLFVSDPVVLELSENRDECAVLGFEKGRWSANLAVFDSEVKGMGHNVSAGISYQVETNEYSVAVGASWIYNVLDADGLTGVLEDGDYFSASEADAVNVWLTASRGRAQFIAEYIQVLGSLEIDHMDTGLKPASLNLECGYAVTETVELGLKYEHSNDVADWFAEQRYGVVCNLALFEGDWVGAGVSLEYLRERMDGEDDANVMTFQFAVEF